MILRRVMKHVSDQNWFAVVLDFIIVVVGVAAGFQLTGYYDESQRRNAEHVYLDGVARDFEIYEYLLVCRTNGEAAIAHALNTLISEIDGNEIDADGRTRILNALPMSHIAQPGLRLEGHTSALVAGDLVKTISNESLRGLILAAQSIGTVAETQLEQINTFYLSIPRFDDMTESAWNEELGFWVITDYDLDTMRQTPRVRDDLINLVNLHRGAESTDARLLQAVQAVLTHLVEMGVRPEPDAPTQCSQPWIE